MGRSDMSSTQFNALLLRISDQLSAKELEKLKFLCPTIGKKDNEKITSGIHLFRLLTERGQLGADNTDRLLELLRHIQRKDLADILDGDENQFGSADNQPDDTERAKLDLAAEVIIENLGKYWRKLGRKLGLKDAKLDSIDKKYPTDLEEAVVQLLKEWRKSRRAEATTEELIDALRACQLNLTADKVTDRLKANGY